MGFQRVPDTAQISIVFTYNGETCINTMYAEKAGGYSLGDLQALAAQVDVQVGSSFLHLQPPEVSYVKSEVRGLDQENDLVAEDSTNAGPGTETSLAVSNQVTFSIKKGSGLTGRSARGRVYWIGIPRSKLDGADENQLLAAYAAELVDAIEDQRVGINAVTGWEAVLVSRFQGGAKRTEGTTFPWTTTTNVDTRVDTQRRRLPD